jgi:micrococcal nuclease
MNYNYMATIERWVDGDTVWLTVDLGFRMTTRQAFRLAGIDTPERGQDGYAAATARANELAPVGMHLPIATYKNPDKFGRWLVDLYLDSGGTVNEKLIDEGFAVAYFGGTR